MHAQTIRLTSLLPHTNLPVHPPYLPLNMETEEWETLEFTSGNPEYQVIFSEDFTKYDKDIEWVEMPIFAKSSSLTIL